jgi:uncharacterized protein YbaR (Trm112 family)
MKPPAFSDLLRCPETHQKLVVATPEALGRLRMEQVAGKLFNRAGKLVTAPVETGLVREDGRMLYPVCEGIPVLVVDEAIALTKFE